MCWSSLDWKKCWRSCAAGAPGNGICSCGSVAVCWRTIQSESTQSELGSGRRVDNLTATHVPVVGEAEAERVSSKSPAMSMEWRVDSRAR